MFFGSFKSQISKCPCMIKNLPPASAHWMLPGQTNKLLVYISSRQTPCSIKEFFIFHFLCLQIELYIFSVFLMPIVWVLLFGGNMCLVFTFLNKETHIFSFNGKFSKPMNSKHFSRSSFFVEPFSSHFSSLFHLSVTPCMNGSARMYVYVTYS